MKILKNPIALVALATLNSSLVFAESDMHIVPVCKFEPIEKTILLTLSRNGETESVKLASIYLNPCEDQIDITGFSESVTHNFITEFNNDEPVFQTVETKYESEFTYHHPSKILAYKVMYSYPFEYHESEWDFIPQVTSLTSLGKVKLDVESGVIFSMTVGDKGKDKVELTYKIIE